MSAEPFQPVPEFRFGLGHPALEFAATLAGRLRRPVERLASPEALSVWLQRAGFGRGLACDTGDLEAARELREAIYRLIDARRRGTRPAPADVAVVNRFAATAPPAPQLDGRLRLHLLAPDPAGALAQIARSSIELLSGPEIERVRNCSDPTCSLMFIDRSRPGRRRWCSMDRCGNKAKTARYRRRERPQPRRSR